MATFELLVLSFQQAATVCGLMSLFALTLSCIIVGLYVIHVYAIRKTGQDDLTSENIYEGDTIYIQTRETALGPMSRLKFHAVNFADARIVLDDTLNRRGNHEHVQIPSYEGPPVWVWVTAGFPPKGKYTLKNMVTGIELVFKRKTMENEDVVNHIRDAWNVVSSKVMLSFLSTYTGRPSMRLLRWGNVHTVAMLHRYADDDDKVWPQEHQTIIHDMELLGIVDRKKKLN